MNSILCDKRWYFISETLILHTDFIYHAILLKKDPLALKLDKKHCFFGSQKWLVLVFALLALRPLTAQIILCPGHDSCFQAKLVSLTHDSIRFVRLSDPTNTQQNLPLAKLQSIKDAAGNIFYEHKKPPKTIYGADASARYGFFTGIQSLRFIADANNNFSSEAKPGWQIGTFMQLQASPQSSFSIDLLWLHLQSDLNYFDSISIHKLEMGNLDLRLIFRFSDRSKRFFGQTGFTGSWLVSGDTYVDHSGKTEQIATRDWLSTFNISVLLGIGYRLPVDREGFKTIEFQLYYFLGLLDMLSSDHLNLKKLQTEGFGFTIGFSLPYKPS